ncbi:MAG: MFS transporter [Streptosporangiaceae bacterium]
MAFALGALIIGTNLPSPLYSVYERRFGFSPLAITMIVAIYVAFLIPALLLSGSLVERAGLRRVLVPSVLLAACGTALFAIAGSTAWLFAARAVQGAAIGTASGPLTVALVRSEPRGDRARASLVGSLMTTGAAGFGPVLAGALAQYAPWPLRLCYLIELVLLAAAVVAVTAAPGAPSPGGRVRIRWPQVPPDIRRQFVLASAASFLAWAVAYIVLALVPSYVTAALHSHNLLLGGIAAGLLLLCAAAAQVILARMPYNRMLRSGLLLLAVGLSGLIAAGDLLSVPLLLATIAAAGVGQGLAFLGALRCINDITPDRSHVGVVSAFYVVTYLGGGGPVIFVGLAATLTGLVPAVQAAAALCGLGCLLTLALLPRAIPARTEPRSSG